ncbi:hypothetical protein LGK95_18365 [Clostridium algoriphilum]|uniref:hypothetical protein n=1 Tax=Clostridium algoriphilum TaxID=198347 RepID=UPI001CF5D0AD|nr:hypothetical protein [Clostridium algoriphilum]MCB2295450.1 hypothetical protein [Clostridium algoriphilum]
MFFNNRKNVYIALVAILVIIAFLGGKSIGTGTVHKEVVKKTVVENLHYNDTLSVKGTKYAIDYSVLNALFLNENSMQFNVNLLNNVNVATIKVIAKDQDNNDLGINANASADTKSLLYTVNLNMNTTKISIFVYPLTPAMVKDTKLDINTIPFKTTTLDVKLLKQQQIQTLQN